MDALGIARAILAGYDWGGRAACVVAALWPDRCAGLGRVNGYLIQDIGAADAADRPGPRGRVLVLLLLRSPSAAGRSHG